MRNSDLLVSVGPAMQWLIPVALIFACLAATGCGKKSWPEPRNLKERFGWTNVQAVKQNSCIQVTARVTEKWSNLDEVALELSPTEEAGACVTCPFHPTQRLTFRPGDAGLSIDGPEITIESCQLNPNTRYRYRLVGKNVHSGLADAYSTIQITPVPE